MSTKSFLLTMSETRIFQTETRPRREVSTSRETENETRREIKQFLNVFKSKSRQREREEGRRTHTQTRHKQTDRQTNRQADRQTEFKLDSFVCLTKIFREMSVTTAKVGST
jgi:hypothetical protein